MMTEFVLFGTHTHSHSLLLLLYFQGFIIYQLKFNNIVTLCFYHYSLVFPILIELAQLLKLYSFGHWYE